MCRCSLCFPVISHEAEFAVSYGSEDRLLRVCRWCEQDLALLGFKANQIVRLEPSKCTRSIPLSLIVLGPVYTLLNGECGLNNRHVLDRQKSAMAPLSTFGG